MKKKNLFIVVLYVFVLIILGACDSSKETTSKADHSTQADAASTQSTDQETTSTNSFTDSPTNKTSTNVNENSNLEDNEAADTSKSKENTVSTVPNEKSGSADYAQSPVPNEDSRSADPTDKIQEVQKDSNNSIHISSGAKAIEYLKNQIAEGKNKEIIFDDMGGILDTDDNGAYYTVELISKSLQKSGGSGTVAIYYVYQDGAYQSKY